MRSISTRDMVMPGAFAQTLRTRGLRRIPMLFEHDPAEPIGVWLDLFEDARGLKARGRLIADVVRAREVLALVRAGAIDGLSIGFRTVRGRIDPRTRVRRLEQIDLWDISIVTFPLLSGARVRRSRRRRFCAGRYAPRRAASRRARVAHDDRRKRTETQLRPPLRDQLRPSSYQRQDQKLRLPRASAGWRRARNRCQLTRRMNSGQQSMSHPNDDCADDQRRRWMKPNARMCGCAPTRIASCGRMLSVSCSRRRGAGGIQTTGCGIRTSGIASRSRIRRAQQPRRPSGRRLRMASRSAVPGPRPAKS